MSIDIKHIASRVDSPVREKEASSSFSDLLNRDIRFGKKIKDKKKENFYSELSMLFAAGIDIKTALEVLVEEERSNKIRKIYEGVKKEVIGGKNLSEALRETGQFDDYEYYSLKIGEESGKVAEVLEDMAVYFSKRIEQKKKLVSVISYPLLVIVSAIGIIIFMLTFIVPMFKDVFKRFDRELPALTKGVIGLSAWFSDYGLWVLLAVIALGILLFSQRKKNWFRAISSHVLMRLPIFGDLSVKIYLARFCQSMHMLIATRNPLLNSIELVKKMVGFYPLEVALEKIEKKIMTGESMHKSMGEFKVFNKKMVSLIKVAEEVNQLDMIFKKLQEQYAREVEHKTGMLGSLLEPLLIMVVGIFVAIILIAMYMPLFELSTGAF